jgi:hypothetical protein
MTPWLLPFMAGVIVGMLAALVLRIFEADRN